MFTLFADAATPQNLPPHTMGEAILGSVVFAVIGIVMAIVGFKIFDWLTPGNLQEEILKKNNIAAAILAGAFIIGLCLIIAAAVG